MKMLLLAFPALIACGDQHSSPDAVLPPDSGSASISVYVSYTDAGSGLILPQSGATALFYDANGNLVDRQVTHSDGRAAGNAPAHSSVTVVPPTTSGDLYTWVDVAPGDQLYTTPVYSTGPAGPVRTASVILPRDGEDVTAYAVWGPRYQAQGTAPASGPVTTAASAYSDAPSVGDLVGDATHGDGHHRFFVARNVALDVPVIDLSTAAWLDATPLDLAFTNVPADAAWLDATYWIASADQTVWSADYLAQLPAAAMFHVDAPGPVDDSSSLRVRYHRGSDAQGTTYHLSFNRPDATTFDLQAFAPPEAVGVAHSANEITWDISGDPAQATGVFLAQQLSNGTSWYAILPPDRRAFEPPVLPADLERLYPAQSAYVSFYAGNEPGGYPALRCDPRVFSPLGYAWLSPKTPGTYRIGASRGIRLLP